MRQEIAVIKIVYLEPIISVSFLSIRIALCYQASGLLAALYFLAFDVILKRLDLVQTQDLAP